MRGGIRFWSLVGVLWVLGRWATAADAGSLLAIDEWSFDRIWKTAQGESHVFKGKLGLKNVGDQELSDLKVEIRIYEPLGEAIRQTSIDYGKLGKGARATKDFTITKAVQFAEVRVVAAFKSGGKAGQAEFTTPTGEKPDLIERGVWGLRLLSGDIDRGEGETGAKHKALVKRPLLTCRVMNLADVKATNPVLKVIFTGVGSGKSGKSKSKGKSSSSNKPGANPGDKVIEIPLGKPLDPGETKVYKELPVNGAPQDFEGFSFEVNGHWEEDKSAGPAPTVVGSVAAGTFTTSDGVLEIGGLEIDETGAGQIKLTVKNLRPAEIPAGKLRLKVIFLSGQDKPVATFQRSVTEKLASGQSLRVAIPAAKVPTYNSYTVEAEY